MGAYLFEATPPFHITHITKEPIVANSFYDTFGWTFPSKIDYIIYPIGVLLDKQYIYVSYGKNDKDEWILKLNKTAFIDSIPKVDSTVLGDSIWISNKPIQGSYQNYTIDKGI